MQNTQIIEQLKEVFTPIAAKIGQGAEFGWEIVIRQQYVEAFIGLGQLILGIIFLVGTFFIVKKAIKECNDANANAFDWMMVGVISAIFGGSFGLFFLISGFHTAITHFINPEYYAIQFFLNLVQ